MSEEREHGQIEHAHDVTIRYTNRAGQRYELEPQGEIQLKMVRPALEYEDEMRLLLHASEFAPTPPTPHLETSPLRQYTIRLLPETLRSRLLGVRRAKERLQSAERESQRLRTELVAAERRITRARKELEQAEVPKP